MLNWLMIAWTALSAADQPQDNRLAVQRIAHEAGEIIGKARHCQMDQVEIEEFYVAAQARINALSRGPEERVMARIQMANKASVDEAKGPDLGCDDFQLAYKKRFELLR